MRIIFMGTPDFAVPSLNILVEYGYHVVAVITATDKYGGRGGKQLIESAVKRYAVDRGIPVLQPKNLKAPDFVEELRGYRADLQIVVAFRMLPEVVWNMPPLGTFNLHGSLLPRFRGAAPIHWAVIEGASETGVTTFFLKHAIDTGDVLLQRKMSIGTHETTGSVHDRMMLLGAHAVLDSVRMIESDDYTLTPQNDEAATKAPKLFAETCKIDFDQPTNRVFDFIRGLNPYPAAWTTLDGKKVKLYRVLPASRSVEGTDPGTFVFNDGLHITTRDGSIRVLSLQMAGKRRMQIREFLNGYRPEA